MKNLNLKNKEHNRKEMFGFVLQNCGSVKDFQRSKKKRK